MSQSIGNTAGESALEDTAAPATPAFTHYDQVAADFIRAFDELLGSLPHFTEAHPATKAFVRMQKTVSDEFLVSVIAAVEETPGMLVLNQFDVTEARDTLQYRRAFHPIRDKLLTAARNFEFSIDRRRADVVRPALQAYAVIKSLARNPGGTLAAAHAVNLRRDLGRAGRKKKSATSADQA